MGKPTAPLSTDKIEPALEYLLRAVDRKADFFLAGAMKTRRSLVDLRRRRLSLSSNDFAAETNAWLDANLTTYGRRTMLAALRRQVADAAELTLGQLLAQARGQSASTGLGLSPTDSYAPTDESRQYVKAVLIRIWRVLSVRIRQGLSEPKVVMGAAATEEEQPTGFTEMLKASKPRDLTEAVDDAGFPFHREWRWLTELARTEQLTVRIERRIGEPDGQILYCLVADPAM